MSYKIKSSDLLRVRGIECYETRGVLRNLPGQKTIVWENVSTINRDKVEILMSACDQCPAEYQSRFWAALSDLDDSQDVLECECGTYILHPVICSGETKEDKREN